MADTLGAVKSFGSDCSFNFSRRIVAPSRSESVGFAVGLLAANIGGISPGHVRCAKADESDVQVYSHNVLYNVRDATSEAQQILKADPDVILLQESEADFVAELQSELGETYPYEASGPERVDFTVDVIMGDFNASASHEQFRHVLDAGYQDAHRLAGCGSGSTWSPVGVGPGVLQLEHTLVSESISVNAHQKLGRAGSDHMAIMSSISVKESDVDTSST